MEKNEDLITLNFEEKKQKIKDIVLSWSNRSLTLFGKVTIIKSLIIPQITYLLSILPNPEISYFKEIDKVIFSFLWDNQPPNLSRTMVLRKIAFGGLNVPDIYAYSKSIKLHWLQKVLDGSFESSWKSLIQLKFPVLENNFIFNCNLKPENIQNVPIKNKCWRDSLKYFFELKSKTTEPLQGDSIIWFNSLLKIEGKTLFYKELHDKGVTYLSDLVNENGRFKTIDELWGQFNCRINCLNYFGLVSIIKSKHINFETKTTNPCPLLSRILNSKSLSKEIHQQFMPSELDFDTIRGLSKWRTQLETDIYFENVFVTYL